jgi:hypothetical protein
MSKSLAASVITTMRANGLLRTDGFSLREGFVGEYTVDKVTPFKAREKSESDDNFRVECTTSKGKANLSGFQVANARVFPSADLKAAQIAKAPGVYTAESLKEEIASSILFNSKFEADVEFPFPAKLKVIGAMVNTDESGAPLIPLRRYKHYNAVLKHHQKEVNDATAFMTREEFAGYLKVQGEKRPAGVPADYVKPALSGNLKADDMSLWSFTLLLTDLPN